MTTPDSQAYINTMASAAGFVLDYHMVMARHDVGVLKAVNDMREQIKAGSALDDKTQELVYIVGYGTAGFAKEHLLWHTRAALQAGATPDEIRQALYVIERVVGPALAEPGLEVLAELSGTAGPADAVGPLDRRAFELLLALGYAVHCGREAEVAEHTRAAVDAGADPKELLDAFEFLLMVTGVITFMHAAEIWAEATGAKGVEPTVPYFVMNNDGTPRED